MELFPKMVISLFFAFYGYLLGCILWEDISLITSLIGFFVALYKCKKID